MKIDFVEEGNSIFAVAQNVEKNGKFYDELWWAELEVKRMDGLTYVTWQDDWQNPEKFATLHDAKAWVILNHNKHIAVINGAVNDLE